MAVHVAVRWVDGGSPLIFWTHHRGIISRIELKDVVEKSRPTGRVIREKYYFVQCAADRDRVRRVAERMDREVLNTEAYEGNP